jgi:hypothetical protein
MVAKLRLLAALGALVTALDCPATNLQRANDLSPYDKF